MRNEWEGTKKADSLERPSALDNKNLNSYYRIIEIILIIANPIIANFIIAILLLQNLRENYLILQVNLQLLMTASNLLYGCKVKPTTKYAFSLLGLAAICAKTGTLKVSVILISLVALTATLVTAKPFTPPS